MAAKLSSIVGESNSLTFREVPSGGPMIEAEFSLSDFKQVPSEQSSVSVSPSIMHSF